MTNQSERRPRLTQKGERTRERIVAAASDLIFANGASRTTLDDVGSAASVGKSQLYHYFRDKNALVQAVIEHQTTEVLASQPQLTSLATWEAWEAWRDHLVEIQRARSCVGGCPLGSLASELSECEPAARRWLASSFDQWEGHFLAGLQRMQAEGLISPQACPHDLATFVLTTLQGGLLLAQLRRDARPLEIAVDTAISHLHTFAL